MKLGDKVRKTLTVLKTDKLGIQTVYAIDELLQIFPIIYAIKRIDDMLKAV